MKFIKKNLLVIELVLYKGLKYVINIKCTALAKFF